MPANAQIHCPHCLSTSVKSRAIIYQAGTTEFQSKRSWSGIVFGGRRTRTFFAWGRSSGKRQSLLARRAAPAALLPPLLFILVLAMFLEPGWIYLILAGWLALAMLSRIISSDEWICTRCGKSFFVKNNKSMVPTHAADNAPENTEQAERKQELPPVEQQSEVHRDHGTGKACSVCGEWFPHSEFFYGNRNNNSYCWQCNKEYSAAYAAGGTQATQEYLKQKRLSWKKRS